MSLPNATRRRSRIVAAALLLVVHLAAVIGLLGLKATRARPGEGMVTLRLSAPRKPVAVVSATPAPRRRTTPLAAPTPTADAAPAQDPAPGIHDSAAPLASESAGPAAPPAPLNLAIPKEFFTHPPPLTVAQEAMLDPRSNRLVLTKQEQMDVDFGVVECIAWQRQPDGSIYRGPGRWQRLQGIGTNPFTSHKPGTEDRGRECVK